VEKDSVDVTRLRFKTAQETITSRILQRAEKEELRRIRKHESAQKRARTAQLPDAAWSRTGSRLYPTPNNISYYDLRSIVLQNSVLFTGITTRASMAVRSGFYVERNSTAKHSAANEMFLREWARDHLRWRSGAGTGGLCSVLMQLAMDRHWFGCGHLELLPADPKERARKRLTRRPGQPESRGRIEAVAHLPRLNVRLLRPVPQVKNVGGRRVEVYSPLDLIYPQLAYSPDPVESNVFFTSTNGRFLKAFGDPRRINMFTGEEEKNLSPEYEATEYIRLRNYVPGYEEGWPEWLSAIMHVDIVDAATEYFRHVLRNNAIPDLMVILKGVEYDKNLTRKLENKFRDVRDRRKNLGYHTNIIVWNLFEDMVGSGDAMFGQPPTVDVTIERMNPVDGNVIRAMLELLKRSELQICMALRMPNQLMNYERNTGIGSGAEITAAVHMVTRLVIGPDQEMIHELLDRIVVEGLGITDYRIRLEQPAYNDPETEAKIARLWSLVQGMTIDEVRDKIGLPRLKEALIPPEDEDDVDVGKTLIVPAANVVLTLDDLKLIFEAATGGDKYLGDYGGAGEDDMLGPHVPGAKSKFGEQEVEAARVLLTDWFGDRAIFSDETVAPRIRQSLERLEQELKQRFTKQEV